MARALTALVATLLLVLGTSPARAQALADPTRPPTGVLPATTATPGETPPAVSTLQSVILRPGAKPRALLGGEWLEVGQEFNGAKIIKITETSVILKGPTGRESLHLTPEAEKKMVKTTRPRGSDMGGMK